MVLGEKKLSYEEYDGMASFYRENFQKFIEYNVHDVDLVYLMDEKLRLIELHVSLAYLQDQLRGSVLASEDLGCFDL